MCDCYIELFYKILPEDVFIGFRDRRRGERDISPRVPYTPGPGTWPGSFGVRMTEPPPGLQRAAPCRGPQFRGVGVREDGSSADGVSLFFCVKFPPGPLWSPALVPAENEFQRKNIHDPRH